jgi:glycosyltransferase involved in cell wall biosynthesis
MAAKLHSDFTQSDIPVVAKLISELGAEGYCRWEGPIPPHKVLDRLFEADMLVLPSFNEPFLMSVLEAMSTGMPAVGDDLTGLPSTVGALIGDRKLRREMSNNALPMTRENFSIENVARELEITFQRVLN